MTFQDRLEIATSEGVTIRLTIAGIGSRSLAWLIDGLLIGVAEFMLGFFAGSFDIDDLLSAGVLAIAALVIPFAYLVGFETLNGGQTLGKKAAGIKVIKSSGAAVGFGSAAIRALFVPFDFLVLGVGLIVMFSNRHSQRIGDIAAKTVVVRDRVPENARDLTMPAPPTDRRWEVSAVTDEEIGVIRSFLSRANELPADKRITYARELRSRIEERVGGVDARLGDEAFLGRVVAEKTNRER